MPELPSNEAFLTWKHHPMTQVFFGLLRDKRDQAAEVIAAQITSGSEVDYKFIESVRERSNIINDILALEYKDFTDYYPETEEKEEDAASNI